ncbi:FAD-dependent monooxygenase [Staphylococcus pseudintermedius]|uniref:FAD-dependent monooxygenase n=1 Tax=Staphylococcus pseudintermedius TaxID=283734 RepID=UPI002885D321|nr:FAD-dependent monooxygenase [Staphylococcus pseudintermedius]MDT0884938.1 FAD-dependent monooxygenase [Staphylococcus pseudintermedius]
MKIGIVGAGIGGLTAAIMLRAQGHDISIYEKQDTISEVGAGIGIGDNVIQMLGEHDLAKGIKNAGQVLTTMRIFDEQGHILNTLPLSDKNTNVTLERQTLVDLLKSYLDDELFHFNHKVTHVESNGTTGTIHFKEQSAVQVDMIIGADGIRSQVRQSVQPKSKVQYQGYTCFRGIVDDMDMLKPIADEYWGQKGRFGIVPLLDGRAYWFATMNAKENDMHFKKFNKPYLQAYFNHFPEPVRKVLDLQAETAILHHDIYDLKSLSTFVYEKNIVLLGDAAHATTPNMGQGAGQSMEDAIVLSNVLKKYDTLESALKRYNRLRVKHTRQITKRSRQIGKVAQKANGLSIKMRNRFMRLLPTWVMKRQTQLLYRTKSE